MDNFQPSRIAPINSFVWYWFGFSSLSTPAINYTVNSGLVFLCKCVHETSTLLFIYKGINV